MGRAYGANATTALAFATSYGAVPASGFYAFAFSSFNLGEEQGQLDSDLLGMGPEPQEPADDVVNNDGDVAAPVDSRQSGLWLKLLFGPPVTTQGVAATGSITPPANPSANDTITVAGQVFTFKASISGANQILIGATLADTLRNAVWALNESAVAGVMAASYSADLDMTMIQVTHDTIGTAGNAFTLAASAATVSGATLAGGSNTGPYNHVFSSGAQTLPDAAIEGGNPEVPSYHMNYGVMGNTLRIPLQRTGLLSMTIGLFAQGERPAANATATGTPTVLEVSRFAQGQGQITDRGVRLGEVVSGEINYSNGLQKAENIREDGRIDGSDPGQRSVTPSVVLRFKDRRIRELALAGKALDIAFGWKRSPTESLTFHMAKVRLPRRTRTPITGPGFIQEAYSMIAYRPSPTGRSLIVTLVNDVPSYA